MDFNSFFKVSVATSLWGFIEMVKPQPWPWMRHVAQKRKEKKNNEVLRLNWKNVSITQPTPVCPVHGLLGITGEGRGVQSSPTASRAGLSFQQHIPQLFLHQVPGFSLLQSPTGVYSSEGCAKAGKLLLQLMARGTSEYQLSPEC